LKSPFFTEPRQDVWYLNNRHPTPSHPWLTHTLLTFVLQLPPFLAYVRDRHKFMLAGLRLQRFHEQSFLS
jgi:hypothetical protein